jgi:hypothetical protein
MAKVEVSRVLRISSGVALGLFLRLGSLRTGRRVADWEPRRLESEGRIDPPRYTPCNAARRDGFGITDASGEVFKTILTAGEVAERHRNLLKVI